ncbi:hypothetical protein HDV05_000762, partial [Chytridiales sp. JEL 0842]
MERRRRPTDADGELQHVGHHHQNEQYTQQDYYEQRPLQQQRYLKQQERLGTANSSSYATGPTTASLPTSNSADHFNNNNMQTTRRDPSTSMKIYEWNRPESTVEELFDDEDDGNGDRTSFNPNRLGYDDDDDDEFLSAYGHPAAIDDGYGYNDDGVRQAPAREAEAGFSRSYDIVPTTNMSTRGGGGGGEREAVTMSATMNEVITEGSRHRSLSMDDRIGYQKSPTYSSSPLSSTYSDRQYHSSGKEDRARWVAENGILNSLDDMLKELQVGM